MGQTPEQRMYVGVSTGNAKDVQQILAEHPEQLHDYPGVAPSWLHYAARKGHLPVIDVFLSLGLSVDHRTRPDGYTPLNHAVRYGQIEAARHLLSLKADPSASKMLIEALNSETNRSELVRLLVEHGANVNQCWRFGDDEQGHLFNALSWAIDGEHDEIADYLRSHGAVLPPQDPPRPPLSAEEEVVRYFDRHVGSVGAAALVEIVPGEFPVAVHVVPAGDDLPWHTLFTTGMSRLPMTVPDGGDDYRYAELVIHLPATWKLTRSALQESRWRWPIDWLRKVAAYPHLNNTWLGGPITIFEIADPPQPPAAGCSFTAALLAAGHDDLGPIKTADGKTIQLFTVLPLYREERDLEIKKGLPELFRRLDQFGVSKVVDVDRRNVAVVK